MRFILLLVLIYININFTYSDNCNFGICNVDENLQTEGEHDIKVTISSIVLYILTFLGIIGVIFVIKGGATILISSGDEEKRKAGIKTIMYSLIGIFIVISAYTIVSSIFIGAKTISN